MEPTERSGGSSAPDLAVHDPSRDHLRDGRDILPGARRDTQGVRERNGPHWMEAMADDHRSRRGFHIHPPHGACVPREKQPFPVHRDKPSSRRRVPLPGFGVDGTQENCPDMGRILTDRRRGVPVHEPENPRQQEVKKRTISFIVSFYQLFVLNDLASFYYQLHF